MTINKNNKIIAFVGLAGSGKTEASEYVVSKKYPKVYFGSFVLDEMAKAGIEHTEENEKKFREDLRKEKGKDYIALKIIDQINDLFNAGQHRVVVESLYTWTEYKTLKQAFPGELIVIAMVAPKRLRHRRLAERPIRPLNQSESDSRDWAEIENLEKGGPIAIADYYIDNGANLDDLHHKIDDLLNEIEFYY